jgi:hypothetical protein
VRAVEQWNAIERRLDPYWEVAFFTFVPEDADAVGGAAGVLAPLGPLRTGRELRFQVVRHGAAPDRLRNLLTRLDRKRIWGDLKLVDVRVGVPETEPEAEPAANGERPLVEQWDDELATLPPGWRDLLAEIELDSTDFVALAALLGAPLNPSRITGETAIRFRVVRGGGGGYGAPPGLARRCLERMDREGVTGRLSVGTALSDVDYVATQGTVWRVAGRSF